MGRGGRPGALCDQRAELRSLQNLRYQRPQPEHHLGAARRWRRPELSEYVIGGNWRWAGGDWGGGFVSFPNSATRKLGQEKRGGPPGAGAPMNPPHAPAPILPPLGPTSAVRARE